MPYPNKAHIQTNKSNVNTCLCFAEIFVESEKQMARKFLMNSRKKQMSMMTNTKDG